MVAQGLVVQGSVVRGSAVRGSVVRVLAGGALVVALALMLFAGPAVAQVTTPNPFQQPGLPQEQATIPSQTQPATPLVSTQSSGGGSGISGSAGLAIGVGAVLILVGISFFIWRDARRRAPMRAATAGAATARTPGSKRVKPRKLSPAERRRRKRGRAR